MIRAIALLLLSWLALSAQVPLDESDQEGTLEIFMVNAFGTPVDGRAARLSVQQLIDEKPGPVKRIGLQPVLRYGIYRLTVLASPGYPVDKIVKISSRYQVVFVTLFLAPVEGPWEGNVVHGTLPKASLEGGCRHVRLSSPLSETEYADNLALPSGTFVFLNVKPGKYVFISIGEKGICDIVPTEVLRDREQVLVLR
jgi:hypothetical protein